MNFCFKFIELRNGQRQPEVTAFKSRLHAIKAVEMPSFWRMDHFSFFIMQRINFKRTPADVILMSILPRYNHLNM